MRRATSTTEVSPFRILTINTTRRLAVHRSIGSIASAAISPPPRSAQDHVLKVVSISRGAGYRSRTGSLNGSFGVSKKSVCGDTPSRRLRRRGGSFGTDCSGTTRSGRIKRSATAAPPNTGRNNQPRWLDSREHYRPSKPVTYSNFDLPSFSRETSKASRVTRKLRDECYFLLLSVFPKTNR